MEKGWKLWEGEQSPVQAASKHRVLGLSPEAAVSCMISRPRSFVNLGGLHHLPHAYHMLLPAWRGPHAMYSEVPASYEC